MKVARSFELKIGTFFIPCVSSLSASEVAMGRGGETLEIPIGPLYADDSSYTIKSGGGGGNGWNFVAWLGTNEG